jgi:carbonic anhydrase
VAGNVVAPSLLASIEFAIAKFQVPLILVLGHAKCGAVQAAISHDSDPLPEEKISHNLKDLLGRLEPAVNQVKKRTGVAKEDFEEACCIANIYESSRVIREQSEIVRAAIADHRLMIAHGYFCLDTGEVKFEPVYKAQ